MLSGLNYQQIGDNCRVTEKTIDRDVRNWVQSGEFEIWLKTLWVKAYGQADKDEAFDALTKIMCRMVTRKQEIREDINVKQKILQVDLNIEQLTSEAAGAIARNYLDHEARQLRQPSDPSSEGPADSN